MSATTAPPERMVRLRARMAETGTDVVVVGPSAHLKWLTGVSAHGDERPVMLLVTPEFAGFLMPALNADSVRQQTALPFFAWSDAEGPAAALHQLLMAAGLDTRTVTLAIDETMRADAALLLLDAVKVSRRSFLRDTVGYLRSRKDESEYALLKQNALLNDDAMRHGFSVLREGITESEVADSIAAYYRQHGAKPEFTIVCFGGNGAFPHHYPGSTRLKKGDAVLIDIGGRMDGYPSDMTRVGTFGGAPDGFAEVHAVLERAVKAAVAAARPGVMAKDVDRAARDVITAAGYGEFFLHRTGHGLGIEVHEEPYITSTSETVLAAGNVFSIEPGIYLAGRFGIRLEEIVILRDAGAEILSELPRSSHAG